MNRADRFMQYVEPCPSTGCWLWVGAVGSTKLGYGMFWWGDGLSVGAHRAAYWLFRERPPSGAHVMRLCDVPLCVNPGHLSIGSAQENVADQVRKGRTALGKTWKWRRK